jgi:transposase-like protein
MGRPTKPIVLNEEERAKLQEWARRPKTAQRLALRARIILGCAEGKENRQVARQLRITDQTVCKWRERFRSAGLDGLADEPRPGTPRKITDAQVEALITRTLESRPWQGTHWSTRTEPRPPGITWLVATTAQANVTAGHVRGELHLGHQECRIATLMP